MHEKLLRLRVCVLRRSLVTNRNHTQGNHTRGNHSRGEKEHEPVRYTSDHRFVRTELGWQNAKRSGVLFGRVVVLQMRLEIAIPIDREIDGVGVFFGKRRAMRMQLNGLRADHIVATTKLPPRCHFLLLLCGRGGRFVGHSVL